MDCRLLVSLASDTRHSLLKPQQTVTNMTAWWQQQQQSINRATGRAEGSLLYAYYIDALHKKKCRVFVAQHREFKTSFKIMFQPAIVNLLCGDSFPFRPYFWLDLRNIVYIWKPCRYYWYCDDIYSISYSSALLKRSSFKKTIKEVVIGNQIGNSKCLLSLQRAEIAEESDCLA